MVLKLMLALICLEHVSCYPGRLHLSMVWDSNLGQLVHRVRRETPTHMSGNLQELTASQGTQNPEQGVQASNTDTGLSAESAGFHGNQHPNGNAQLSDKQADPVIMEGVTETPVYIQTDKLMGTKSEVGTDPQHEIAVDSHTASEHASTQVEHTQHTASQPAHNSFYKPQPAHNPQFTPNMGLGTDTSGQLEQAPTDVTEPAQAPVALPLKGHFPTGAIEPGDTPIALPQTGADPSRQRAPDARGKIWGRQFRPVALPQRQAPSKNAGQGNQGGRKRPPPNWGKGGNARAQGPSNTGQQAPANKGQQVPPSPMPGMPPHPMFDYRYYNPYSYMYGPPPPGQAAPGAGGAPMPTGYPYPPYPPYSMGGDRPDMEGFGPGFNLDIRNMGRYAPCMNMSDPMCIQQRMMGAEMDIETPYGEIDMESPYELDIEGPMAYGMLRNFGIGNITDAHYPEITLNNHILAAMQKRFGVNTTAGIQRMSGNPEFQAFMYQILTQSSPVSLAEFNANLTKAEVDRIITNLDASPPNQRIPVSNLNHAQLNTQGASRNGASLTLDNNPASNLWSSLGAGTPFGPSLGVGSPFGPFPGQPNPFFPPHTAPTAQSQTAPIAQSQTAPIAQSQTAPYVAGHTARLVQGARHKQAAKPGRFEALVQRPNQGEGIREAGEAREHREQKSATAPQEAKVKTETSKTQTHPVTARKTTSTGAAGTDNLVATKVNPKTKITSNTGNTGIPGARNQAQANTDQSQPARSQPNQSQAPRSQIDQSKAPVSQIHQSHFPVSQIDQSQASQPQSGSKAPASSHVTKLMAAPPAVVSSNTKLASVTKEQDIIGKENNKGLSKDQITMSEKTKTMAQPNGAKVSQASGTSMSGTGIVAGAPGVNSGVPANSQTNNVANSQGGRSDSIPIGIKEAGLVPTVMNNTVPVKAESGYTSTGFAIAAATIIALIIILGPIACMLCKMKEKRQERKRKQKAHKNRDMSENNIMESMVLHDFGKSGANSVANEKAKPYDYIGYGRDSYSTVNADLGEIERLSGNPHSQRGRLP